MKRITKKEFCNNLDGKIIRVVDISEHIRRYNSYIDDVKMSIKNHNLDTGENITIKENDLGYKLNNGEFIISTIKPLLNINNCKVVNKTDYLRVYLNDGSTMKIFKKDIIIESDNIFYTVNNAERVFEIITPKFRIKKNK